MKALWVNNPNLGTGPNHCRHKGQGRRLAHVIGIGFKSHTKHNDRFAVKAALADV